MKAFLSSLILIAMIGGAFAQELDSLKGRSTYQRAWDAAMFDGKITDEERVLMNILVEALVLSVDSSRVWESQWGFRVDQPLDQSGRWPLVLQNIVIGSALYGWAIPYVLHAEDGRWFVGGEMVSMGAAFYLTYKYTKGMEMSHARTQMMRYGSLVGLRYGVGMNQLFDLYEGDGEDRETLWAWILMGSVPVGHYGGELLFDKYNPSNGQAWAWTMWTGAAGVTARNLHSVMNDRPEEPADLWDAFGNYDEIASSQYDEDMDNWDKRKTITELIAYPAGAWVGYKLVKDKQYTFGDALMLMQGWGFGFYNTMMLQSILFDEGDEDMFFLVSALGAIGSTFAYDYWIKDDDFTFGQATLMLLGSGSGSAFGFGTAILLDVTDKEPMLTMALLGYGAGTWLTRQILDTAPDGSLAYSDSRRVTLSPTALVSYGANQKPVLIPALELNFSFK